MQKLTLFALIFWFISRMAIIHLVPLYVSDVPYYHWLAMDHVWNQKKLYVAHSFAYPPLAMPFVLWPAYLARDLSQEMYRYCFQWTIFLLEAGTLFLMIRYARQKLKLSHQHTALSIALLTIFGILQPHLLYDRMDIGVAFFLLGTLFLWEKKLWLSIAWACVGNLFKIIPAIFLAFPLAEKLLSKYHHQDIFSRWCMRAAAFAVSFVPVVTIPLALEKYFFPGMSASLVEHLKRGIQIESVWATPFMLWKAVYPKSAIAIGDYFGAQEVIGALITPGYMLLAKTTGFLLLGILFLHFLARVGEKGSCAQYRLHTALSFVLLFLATQRVLSPQFFIWLMPLAALWLAQAPKALELAGFFGLYSLTFVSFDLGYVELVNTKLNWVSVLAARNFLLIFLAGSVVFRFLDEMLLEPMVVRRFLGLVGHD